MLGMHMGRVPAPSAAEDAVAESGERATFDTEDWLQLINRASIVANVEAGLLDRENAGKLARALDDMRREGEKPGAKRAELYITFEPELLRRAGMAASVLHVGRSSQDILATANAGLNLERLVKILAALSEVRRALLELAERERETVVPAYTNGVQAQPTLYSHYLLAQISVFGRDVERAFECIRRFDFCPMGSTVLNGTGWPLRVERMAELLGFSRALANAFDAGQCAGNDLPLEMSQIVTAAMLHVNAFLADFMVQYATPHPWIRMESTNGEYRSSSMPQKRNPGLVNDLRRDAGLVIGEAQGVMMRMQNLCLGMADVRDARMMKELADDACIVLRTFAGFVRTLRVDRDRALAELNADWTCTQEIADRLVRSGHVDFRSGHGFASRLVTWARERGVTPPVLGYGDVLSLWTAFRADAKNAALPENFPLSEAELREATSPEGIVKARATKGSANPEMVAADLERERETLGLVAIEIQKLGQRRSLAEARLDLALCKTLAG